jgi:type II secretory pathway component PulF
MKEKATSSIQVIDRMAQLLDAIAQGHGPVSLKILSAETRLHPSTAHRILAALGEHEERIRMRIKAATRYPLIVVAAIVIGFLVLTAFVVPRFAQIYAQFTTALPLPTRILLWLHGAITKFWWLSILAIGAAVFIFNKFINTKAGRFWWDSLKLKAPVFGPLILKLSMSRFSRITATLLESGVPILRILDLAAGGAGNAIISRTIDNIKVSVTEGKGLAEPMKVSGMFPATVVQMVSVGEATGKLSELLINVSDYYDSQVDYTISNLASLIEPILIVVLGSVVLFMALAIFLPMWNLMSLFKR